MAESLRESLLPYNDDRVAIGSPSRRFAGVYTVQLTMDGDLDVDGATTLNGAVTLGNAAGDAITVTGTIASNVIFTDNTLDIGASGATRPRTLYLGTGATIPALTTATSATFTGATIAGIRSPAPVVSAADTIAPTDALSGTTYFLSKGSATQVVTLPAPLVGQRFTFVCGDAAGEILINPTAATTRIVGKGFDVTSATAIKNTAATNVLGDTCSLVCSVAGASGTWVADVVTGTWAAQ